MAVYRRFRYQPFSPPEEYDHGKELRERKLVAQGIPYPIEVDIRDFARGSIVKRDDDIAPYVNQALAEAPGHAIYIPKHTSFYTAASRIVVTGYSTIVGEWGPGYQSATYIKFINGSGFLLTGYTRLANLMIRGPRTDINETASSVPELGTFGSIGVATGGDGSYDSGLGSTIDHVSIENFATGFWTGNGASSGGQSYFKFGNLFINYCCVGLAVTGATTDFRAQTLSILSCARDAIYGGSGTGGGYRNIEIANLIVEACGSTAVSSTGYDRTKAGVRLQAVTKARFFNVYSEGTTWSCEKGALLDLNGAHLQTTHLWGEGAILLNNSPGDPIDISPDPDVATAWTASNCTVTANNTPGEPQCFRIQSTAAPGTNVQISISNVPLSRYTDPVATTYNGADEVARAWLTATFWIRFDTNPPTTPWGGTGFNPSFAVRNVGATSGDSLGLVTLDQTEINFADNGWHRLNIMNELRFGTSYIQGSLATLDVVLVFRSSGSAVNYDPGTGGTALDVYYKPPQVTLYTIPQAS